MNKELLQACNDNLNEQTFKLKKDIKQTKEDIRLMNNKKLEIKAMINKIKVLIKYKQI